jgi:predicted AlkP superfamily pyrophosphatase or phosphodiesterase
VKRTAILNVVGLSGSLLGPATPRINRFLALRSVARIVPAFPAVTCTAQSNYLTGTLPAAHGIVANGWYERELSEVQFWKQSNRLVAGRKLWEDLREADPTFTCAKLFWWYNMYSTADYSITPRPMYPADGRKVFDIYTQPASIRGAIKQDLGEFPFPAFWGPAAGVDTPQASADAVSLWIAASAKWIENRHHPTLSLIYLPHLDYNLQRLGPSHPRITQDVHRIDAIAGDLIDFFEERDVEVIILSEYGISGVNSPIHLNRLFRGEGWIAIREELGLELLDMGASRVFAVADHQVAHIYVNDSSVLPRVRRLLESQPGIKHVLGPEEKRSWGINHPRAGDLVAISKDDAWFTYYYWMDDSLAPDFARCVDIHRKPGYDPVELFLDPAIAFPRMRILFRLLQKKLGFRMLMDVVPLDASLVRGSHGARPELRSEYPLVVAASDVLRGREEVDSTEVYGVLRDAITGGGPDPGSNRGTVG